VLNEIVKIMEHKKDFQKKYNAVIIKILGAFLYPRALSSYDASKILGIVEPASYEAVRYWYKQFKDLFVIGCKER